MTIASTAVLFICMGNICRSPTAEGVFRAQAIAAGINDRLDIDSAGTHGYHIGEPPDLRSQEFAAKRGIDLSTLRARKVDAKDFTRFDLILAMDKDNLALLKKACPAQHQHKLALFMDYAQHTNDDVVPDPYYGSTGGFEQVLDYVEDASAGLVARLRGQTK